MKFKLTILLMSGILFLNSSVESMEILARLKNPKVVVGVIAAAGTAYFLYKKIGGFFDAKYVDDEDEFVLEDRVTSKEKRNKRIFINLRDAHDKYLVVIEMENRVYKVSEIKSTIYQKLCDVEKFKRGYYTATNFRLWSNKRTLLLNDEDDFYYQCSETNDIDLYIDKVYGWN